LARDPVVGNRGSQGQKTETEEGLFQPEPWKAQSPERKTLMNYGERKLNAEAKQQVSQQSENFSTQVRFPPREMSDYELRPPRNKQERMMREYPYGIWTCADGREYLFNRRYRPIHRRMPGCPGENCLDPMELVPWVDQQWFYGGNVPWDRGKDAMATCDRCEKALRDFWDGFPVTGMQRSWRAETEAMNLARLARDQSRRG
jgi:hypothetical protein